MNEQLPSQIERRELPGGVVRYILPRRHLGLLGLLVAVAMPAGVAIATAVAWGLIRDTHPGLEWIKFILIPAIAVTGIAVTALAAVGLFGHSEVELHVGHLRAVAVLGPIRIGSSRPVEDIQRFSVEADGLTSPVAVRFARLRPYARDAERIPPERGTEKRFSVQRFAPANLAHSNSRASK